MHSLSPSQNTRLDSTTSDKGALFLFDLPLWRTPGLFLQKHFSVLNLSTSSITSEKHTNATFLNGQTLFSASFYVFSPWKNRWHFWRRWSKNIPTRITAYCSVVSFARNGNGRIRRMPLQVQVKLMACFCCIPKKTIAHMDSCCCQRAFSTWLDAINLRRLFLQQIVSIFDSWVTWLLCQSKRNACHVVFVEFQHRKCAWLIYHGLPEKFYLLRFLRFAQRFSRRQS